MGSGGTQFSPRQLGEELGHVPSGTDTHASVQGLVPGKPEPCRVCAHPRPPCALIVDTSLFPLASASGPATRHWHPYAPGVTGGEQNEMTQVRGQAMERP